MDLGLQGKTVLVTGGAKGIGEGIVRALGEEGAIPVIVDRDEAAGRLLVDDMAKASHRCELVVADLEEPGRCPGAVEEAVEKAGRIHGLVNNAGINDNVGLRTGSAQEFMDSLRRNVLHYFEMTQCALPYLKASKGSVVNISSKVALTGQGGTSGYTAAKGGILALTREWAIDLLEDGVRVNAVLPGDVMTPLYRQWLDTFPDPQEKLESIVSNIPLENRMTPVEEIAAMTVFLLSPSAGHITGQHLVLDGGYVHLDRAIT
jgi:NAD(P)-dependent dehydrogenase (short-subunit alcohol dehydrogenase family)